MFWKQRNLKAINLILSFLLLLFYINFICFVFFYWNKNIYTKSNGSEPLDTMVHFYSKFSLCFCQCNSRHFYFIIFVNYSYHQKKKKRQSKNWLINKLDKNLIIFYSRLVQCIIIKTFDFEINLIFSNKSVSKFVQ